MCEVNGMTKASFTDLMMDNIQDFYLYIDHNRISSMFLQRMRDSCGVMTSKEIPDFFMNSSIRQVLTSTSISAFEFSIINKCVDTLF